MKNTMIKILLMFIVCLVTATTGHSQGVKRTIAAPPTQYSVQGGGSYCAGQTAPHVGLSGSDLGSNYQYQLRLNGVNTGLPMSGSGGPLDFGEQANGGIYDIVATNISTGCIATMSNTATVTVYAIPSITITASGPVEFCGTGTVTLTANAGSGCTYQWENNGNTIPGANSSIYVANATGMFSVIATNGLGCFNEVAQMVISNPLPQQFNVTSSATSFCEGSSGVTITLNGSQDNTHTYQLMLNGVASGSPVAGTNSALNWTNQTAPGVYSVEALNSDSCTSIMTGSAVVSMSPLPNNATTITGPTSVCQGSTVSFYTNPVLNATSYIWSVPMGATITSGGGTTMITVQFNGSTSGDVTVFGQNSCGGGQPYIFPVTVNTAPTLNVTATAMDICTGESTNLTATGTGVSFVWSGGMITSTVTVNPTGTTTYYVTATGANSCTATDDIIITVHALPSVSLNLVEDNYCTSINSAVLAGGLPAGGTYTGTCVFGGSTIYPPVSGPGTYVVTYEVTDTWGCSNSATDLLTINPTPVVMFSSIVGTVYVDTPPFDLMGNVSPVGGTFTGTGMVGSLFNPATAGPGTHIITYTYVHPVTGCSASQIQYITVGTVGVDEVTAAVNLINMFPNPATDQLNLIGIDTKEIASLQIFDILGKVVYSTDIKSSSITINVNDFNSGTYLIRFLDADGISVTKRFMKSE